MTTVRDRAARRPRGVTTARRSVGLGLVEILSWMRHCGPGVKHFGPLNMNNRPGLPVYDDASVVRLASVHAENTFHR